MSNKLFNCVKKGIKKNKIFDVVSDLSFVFSLIQSDF